MNLIAIKIQSVSDLITNSSSELFQLRTDHTLEEVNEILDGITSGYLPPIVFKLDDYYKATELYREQEPKLREKYLSGDNSDWYIYEEEVSNIYPNIKIYNTISGWFFDEKDPKQIEQAYKHYVLGIDSLYNTKSILNSIQKEFREFVIKNNYKDPDFPNWWNPYNIEDKAFEEFKKIHPIPPIEELEKYAGYYGQNIKNLDGCILVLSESDNSIPYETWDLINTLLNGINYHLG